MDSPDIYQLICEIFKEKEINYDLMVKLNQKNISDIKTTIKIYLLQFLFDQEEKAIHILNKNDIWFIRENPENVNMINKYIILLNNIIKKDDISSIDIIKEIESFINTNIGTKLIYIISILNKFNLQNIIYLKFLGFIIGEKKDFIKRNYLLNLQNLLEQVDTPSKIYSNSTSENTLEILNLYIFFKEFLSYEKNYISSLKNALNTLDYSQDFNMNLYYIKLIKEELLDKLFFKEENNLSSDIFIKKVLNLKQVIINKVEDFKKFNQDLFEDDLSNNEESLNEINELIELEEEGDEEKEEGNEEENEEKDLKEEEKEDKKEVKEKKEKENKIIINNSKMQNLLLSNNIKLSNNKSSASEKESNEININNDIENYNITTKGENNIQENEISRKDLLNERTIKIIKDSTETKNDKEKDEINLIDNTNITNDNNGEKKDLFTNTKNSITSCDDDKNYLDNINDFINYPSIKQLNIQEKEEDSQNGKILLIFRIARYIDNFTIKRERLNYILRSSIFDIISEYMRIIDDSKFRIFEITNLRLEILINLIKNPNIINIKRKLIEVMIFHLYSENSSYFKVDINYEPSSQNLLALKNLIENKLSNDKSNKDISNDLNKLKKIIENKDYVCQEKEGIFINKIKKRQLKVAKIFLDFYKKELNPDVHINENKSNLYLLPRSMFNTEIKSNEYLIGLESIIGNGGENGVKENNDKEGKKDKVFDFHLYNENKFLKIDEALNILFSFNSKCKFIEDNAFKELKEKQNNFEKDMEKTCNFFKNIFSFQIGYKESTINFGEEINKKILEYVGNFENEVINKLYKAMNSIIENRKDADIKIIDKIKIFIENFILNCDSELDEFESGKNQEKEKQILYFLKIKTIIIEKIIQFFENSKDKIIKCLTEKEQKHKDIVTQILSNIKDLSTFIENNKEAKNEFKIYQKWREEQNYSKESHLSKLKMYFKTYINQQLNLEMNYTFDSQFCLWAIKKDFAKYFD